MWNLVRNLLGSYALPLTFQKAVHFVHNVHHLCYVHTQVQIQMLNVAVSIMVDRLFHAFAANIFLRILTGAGSTKQ